MKSGIINAALAAVALINAAKMMLMAKNVIKIAEALLPNRRIMCRAARLTKSVRTMALAMMKADTFNQIVGSPKVAMAGFAFKIPVKIKPQINNMEVT